MHDNTEYNEILLGAELNMISLYPVLLHDLKKSSGQSEYNAIKKNTEK